MLSPENERMHTNQLLQKWGFYYQQSTSLSQGFLYQQTSGTPDFNRLQASKAYWPYSSVENKLLQKIVILRDWQLDFSEKNKLVNTLLNAKFKIYLANDQGLVYLDPDIPIANYRNIIKPLKLIEVVELIKQAQIPLTETIILGWEEVTKYNRILSAEFDGWDEPEAYMRFLEDKPEKIYFEFGDGDVESDETFYKILTVLQESKFNLNITNSFKNPNNFEKFINHLPILLDSCQNALNSIALVLVNQTRYRPAENKKLFDIFTNGQYKQLDDFTYSGHENNPEGIDWDWLETIGIAYPQIKKLRIESIKKLQLDKLLQCYPNLEELELFSIGTLTLSSKVNEQSKHKVKTIDISGTAISETEVLRWFLSTSTQLSQFVCVDCEIDFDEVIDQCCWDKIALQTINIQRPTNISIPGLYRLLSKLSHLKTLKVGIQDQICDFSDTAFKPLNLPELTYAALSFTSISLYSLYLLIGNSTKLQCIHLCNDEQDNYTKLFDTDRNINFIPDAYPIEEVIIGETSWPAILTMITWKTGIQKLLINHGENSNEYDNASESKVEFRKRIKLDNHLSTSLKNVSLNDYQLELTEFVDFLRICPQLQEIYLKNSAIQGNIVDETPLSLPYLKKFVITNNYNFGFSYHISLSGINFLLQAMPNLESFICDDQIQIEDQRLTTLPKLRKLKYFSQSISHDLKNTLNSYLLNNRNNIDELILDSFSVQGILPANVKDYHKGFTQQQFLSLLNNFYKSLKLNFSLEKDLPFSNELIAQVNIASINKLEELKIDASVGGPLLSLIFKHANNLKSLELNYSRNSSLNIWMEKYTLDSLEKITIRYMKQGEVDESLIYFLSQLPSLKQLKIDHGFTFSYPQQEKTNTDETNHDKLSQEIKPFKKLKFISSSIDIVHQLLPYIDESLEILNLTSSDNFDITHLLHLFSHLPKLIRCYITSILSEEECALIKTKFPNLIFESLNEIQGFGEYSNNFVASDADYAEIDSVESDTRLKDKTYQVDLIFYPKVSNKLDPRFFRLDIFVEGGEIIESHGIIEPVSYDELNGELDYTYYENYKNDPNIYSAKKELELTLGLWKSLPSLSAGDKLIYLQSTHRIEYGYSQQACCWKIRLAPKDGEALAQTKIKVNVLFGIAANILHWIPDESVYKNSVFQYALTLLPHIELIDAPQYKLPVSICQNEIYERLKAIDPFYVMTALIVFLNQFKPGNQILDASNLRAFFQQIHWYKIGACDSRAKLGYIITRALGYPIHFEGSHSHAYLYFHYNNHWYFCDPGGYPAQERLINNPVPTKQLLVNKAEAKKQTEMVQVIKAMTHDNRFVRKHLNKPLYASFDELWQTIMLKGQNLPLGKKNILITFNNVESMLGFHQLVLLARANANKEYTYVHNFDDIALNDMKIEEGSYTSIPSSLITSINTAGKEALFAVNFTHMKGEHIGYNTMVDDDERHLKHHVFPLDTVILGYQVVDAGGASGNEIESRFKAKFHCNLNLSPTLLTDISTKPTSVIPSVSSINLYGGYQWEKELEGRVLVEGQAFHFKSQLLKTLLNFKNDLRNLQLSNAPLQDEKFILFCLELMIRKRFWANGEWHHVPDDFKLSFNTTENTLKGNYTIEEFSLEIPAEWDFPLNEITYDSFFSSYKVENNQVYTLPGLLATHSSLTILVNVNLSDHLWQRLIDQANANHCQLHLLLAQGNSLPNQMYLSRMTSSQPIATEDEPSTKKQKHAATTHIIETNERYYAEDVLVNRLMLTENNSIVITVTEETEYCDLFEKLLIEKNPSGWYLFRNRTTQILQAVCDDDLPKTLLLKGKFNSRLLANLQSIFASRPYLWINHHKHYIRGEIYILTEQAQLFPFSNQREIIQYDHSRIWDMLAPFADNKYILQLKKCCMDLNLEFTYAECRTILKRHQQGIALYQILKGFIAMQDGYETKLVQLKEYFNITPKVKNQDNPVIKRLTKVERLLKQCPILFLVGSTGTGKSSLILDELIPFYKQQGIDAAIFSGLNRFNEWANASKNNELKFLYLDEANTREGYEIFENWPYVQSEEKIIKLTEQHFLIASGNFRNYARRTKSQFFDNTGNYYIVKDYPAFYIKDTILGSLAQPMFPELSAEERTNMIEHFYDVYQFVNNELKPVNKLSLRNLKMMLLRLRMLLNDKLLCQKFTQGVGQFSEYVKLIRLSAMYDEIKHYLNKQQKEQLKDKILLVHNNLYKSIKQQAIAKQQAHIAPTKVIARNQIEVLASLSDHLQMRQLLIDHPEYHMTKNHVIVEGDSGNGKSTIVKNFLISQGHVEVKPLEKNAQVDSRKQFICVTPTDVDEIKKIKTEAFHTGKISLNDEGNTIPLEEFSNQLKAGFDLDGKPAAQRGYMEIDTQNSHVNYKNRVAQSVAELNRVDKIIMGDFLEEELTEILTRTYKLPSDVTQELIADYMKAREMVDQHLIQMPRPNPRDLFAEAEIEQLKLSKMGR